MELKNARTLGPSELYERRKQAVALFRKGMSRTEIAPLVGAHRNTVGQWIRDWQAGGMKALKPDQPGRPVGQRPSPDGRAGEGDSRPHYGSLSRPTEVALRIVDS